MSMETPGPVCLLKAKGLEFVDALPVWQIGHLPILPMMEAGVPIEKIREWSVRIDADEEARAAERIYRETAR